MPILLHCVSQICRLRLFSVRVLPVALKWRKRNSIPFWLLSWLRCRFHRNFRSVYKGPLVWYYLHLLATVLQLWADWRWSQRASSVCQTQLCLWVSLSGKAWKCGGCCAARCRRRLALSDGRTQFSWSMLVSWNFSVILMTFLAPLESRALH